MSGRRGQARASPARRPLTVAPFQNSVPRVGNPRDGVPADDTGATPTFPGPPRVLTRCVRASLCRMRS